MCRTKRHPRLSVVHLPHSTGDSDTGDDFAWLVTQERDSHDTISNSHIHDGRDEDGSGVSNLRSSNCDAHNSSASSRRLLLCLGTLDWEPRGRYHRRPLPWVPTHLAYVAITRSIVVAGYENSDNNDNAAAGAYRDSVTQLQTTPCCSSVLRIFDADTLEERPGGPLRFRPGVRVTGIAPLGLGALPNISLRTKPANVVGRSGKNIDLPAAAVGGDVVAVASCCTAAVIGEQREDNVNNNKRRGRRALPQREGTSTADGISGGGTTAVADEIDPDGLVTVVTAFEVVACGSEGTVGVGVGGGHGRVAGSRETPVSRVCVDDSCTQPKASDRGNGGATFLAPLAASTEMAGACFCLRAVGTCFLAASVNDRTVIFGWEGRETPFRCG